jgi:hypothetical protein
MSGPLSPQQTMMIYNQYHAWAAERKKNIKEADCDPGDRVSLRVLGERRVGVVINALANGNYDVLFWTKTLRDGRPDTTSPQNTAQGVKRRSLRRHVSNRMPTEMRHQLVRKLGLTKGDDEVSFQFYDDRYRSI